MENAIFLEIDLCNKEGHWNSAVLFSKVVFQKAICLSTIIKFHIYPIYPLFFADSTVFIKNVLLFPLIFALYDLMLLYVTLKSSHSYLILKR